MKLAGFIGGGVAVVGLAASGLAMAHENVRTQQGAMVHWNPGELRVALDPETRSNRLDETSVLQAVNAAREAWNRLPEIRSRFVLGPGGPHNEGDSVILIRFCKGSWNNDAGLLGHTDFEADIASGLIRHAVIQINECDYQFLAPDEVGEEKFDLQSVLTHELGHVLGLGHSSDPRAVMFANTGNARQRHPTMDDRTAVAMLSGLPAPTDKPLLTVSVTPLVTAPRVRKRLPVPENVVMAIEVESKDHPGQHTTIYTCQPTILPAISVVEDPAKARSEGRSKARSSGKNRQGIAAPPSE